MKKFDERDILEKQLLQAKRDLFRATTIRELKAIQNRIYFLTEKLKKLDKNRI